MKPQRPKTLFGAFAFLIVTWACILLLLLQFRAITHVYIGHPIAIFPCIMYLYCTLSVTFHVKDVTFVAKLVSEILKPRCCRFGGNDTFNIFYNTNQATEPGCFISVLLIRSGGKGERGEIKGGRQKKKSFKTRMKGQRFLYRRT